MMQNFNNSKWAWAWFAAGFFAVLAIGGMIISFIKDKENEAVIANLAPAPPKPDDIAVQDMPDGGQLVDDKTSDYSFALPASWYLERGAGAGVTIYPNYD